MAKRLFFTVFHCVSGAAELLFDSILVPRSMLFDAAAFWLYDNRESLMLEDDDEIDG